jgi:hypothetical protein
VCSRVARDPVAHVACRRNQNPLRYLPALHAKRGKKPAEDVDALIGFGFADLDVWIWNLDFWILKPQTIPAAMK